MENFADEVILAQSTLILCNPKNLDTANGMFHFDAGTRDLGIGRLLFGCEIFPSTVRFEKSIKPARQVITAFLTVCFFFFPL